MVSNVRRALNRLRGYRGNIDGYRDGALVGWVAHPDNLHLHLRVGLYTRHGLLAQSIANVYRGDLEEAGIGDGRHGYAIPVDAMMLAAIAENGGRVELRTMDAPRIVLGQHSFDQKILTAPGTQGAAVTAKELNAAPPSLREIGSLIFGDINQLRHLLSLAAQYEFPIAQAPLAPHRKIFAQEDFIHGGPLPGLMNNYAEYVRYRYKLDKTFKTQDEAADVDHFLHWYLAGYSTLRKGLRVPMSQQMISHLNEPMVIGGQRTSLTRVTWQYLMGVPPLLHAMNFGNADWVNWAIYWWSINQAKAMHCEDCLVPPAYVARLSAVAERWHGKSFAPSEFMLRYRNENAALLRLDIARDEDRRTLALVLLVMAVQRPDFLRYIPAETVAALLEPRGETASAFSTFVAEFMSEGEARTITREDYARALRLRGFDLETLQFVNFTSEGHRLEAAMLPPVVSDEIVDVQMIGPFAKASGLGQATRLSAEVMSRTRFTTNSVDFGLDNPAPEGFSRVGALSDYKRAKVNIIHLNAESIPLVYAYEPDAFSGAYNIGYFFWELNTPAACHFLGMEMLDEIWVSTEYGVEIYQPNTQKPVVNVGMCYEDLPEIPRAEARAMVRDRFGFDGSEFVFLVAFDSFSFVQRKNPIGTLKAFKAAFADTPDVRLVIKTQNRSKVADPVQKKIWAEVDRLIAGDPRIVILDETLTYADLLKLKKGCDCYVSLHKSEGWGFGMIEAMNLRVPVICTAYSGNMDFCSDETAWLVGYEEVELTDDDYIFVRPGQKWVEPDIEDAAAQMRRVFEDPETRAAKADAALRFVQEKFSASAIAERYSTRLEDILAAGKATE